MSDQALCELQKQGYRPRTLLDIGAHVGSFTRTFLEFFPDCRPTLVEPNPYCRDDLGKLGVEQHEFAASDKSGKATLFLTKEWLQSTGSSLYRENTQHFRDEVVIRQDVETRRIDDVFPGRQFDFVKIDTQGAELDVLRGGENVLRNADYILLEVSLVDYNAGGAPAEAIFEQLRAMDFRCCDVTEFHRLRDIQNGQLLQMDFLFVRRGLAKLAARTDEHDQARLVAETLIGEGRNDEATTLLELLATINPGDADTVAPLVKLLDAHGRTLDALKRLAAWKNATRDMEDLVAPIQEILPSALTRYNHHAGAGEVAEAEKYVSALVALIPHNPALLDTALSCSLALGHVAKAKDNASTLLRLDPAHARARAVIQNLTGGANSASLQMATDETVQKLLRLRDTHDAISELLCESLTEEAAARVKELLGTAHEIAIDAPPGSEHAAWEKHYRTMIDGIDVDAVQGPTPAPCAERDIELQSSMGAAASWLAIRAAAARLGAKTVFFAAADRAYVDLYARVYIKSLLKNCDVPFLVVVHVTGGAGQLRDVAKTVGIRDKRLFYSGDAFDAESVTTKCYDSPPKGTAKKPLAHLQSVRFLRLRPVLEKLGLPVIVSDIDLILQRGVKDLLDRTAKSDVVLNKNEANRYAGSRLTANLVCVNPTANAGLFLRFLETYLDRRLGKPEISRWIDQLALLMAQHHLAMWGDKPRVDYFDASSDINNLVYPSYQDNPYRFFSLYHGFDMASLDQTEKDIPTARPPLPQHKRVSRRVRRQSRSRS